MLFKIIGGGLGKAGQNQQKGGGAGRRPPLGNPPNDPRQDLAEFLQNVIGEKERQQASPTSLDRVEEVAIVEAEVIEDSKWGSSVEDHLQSHMAAGHVTEHASHLGDKAALADERAEKRLHERFDHQIGTLKETSSLPGDDYIAEGTDASFWTEHTRKKTGPHPRLRNQRDARRSTQCSQSNHLERDTLSPRRPVVGG